jgi:inner membrane protein
MHCPTHLMSGWCIGNLFSLNGRQRVGCMLAAAVADVDALAVLGGWDAYQIYHHKLAHNLLFGVLGCAVLWWFTGRRAWVFLLYLALFHLHLVMDFFGSGPGWGIYYFWPFSQWTADNWHYSWEFSSWQNTTTAAVLLAWTVAIANYKRRTPLEVLMPNLDRQLVELLYKVLRRPLPQ